MSTAANKSPALQPQPHVIQLDSSNSVIIIPCSEFVPRDSLGKQSPASNYWRSTPNQPQGDTNARQVGEWGVKWVPVHKVGHWDEQQCRKYHWFLEKHAEVFLQRGMRAKTHIFIEMARFIATRKARQCRCHHQKMETRFGGFLDIIQNLRMINYRTLDVEPLRRDLVENGEQQTISLHTFDAKKPQGKKYRRSVGNKLEGIASRVVGQHEPSKVQTEKAEVQGKDVWTQLEFQSSASKNIFELSPWGMLGREFPKWDRSFDEQPNSQ